MRSLLRPRLVHILSAILLLAGCVDDPTASAPEPDPKPAPRVVGLYEVTLTGIGGGSDVRSSVAAVPTGPRQSLSPVATGLGIELISSTYMLFGPRGQGGHHYVTTTYRLRNLTGRPLANLTIIPAMTASTISGTPFTSILLTPQRIPRSHPSLFRLAQ